MRMDLYSRYLHDSGLPRDKHMVLCELCGGIIIGALSHWLYFIHGDNHHMKAPLYFRLYIIVVLSVYSFQVYLMGLSYGSAVVHTALLVIGYCASLLTSMAIYRYFFHQTRSFPGPRLAAVTKFWHVWQVRKSQNHLVMTALYKQYGDFVRTGPNEITIFHPDGLNASNGPASRCTKANWYDFLKPQVAINTNRSVEEHEARRKLWKPAFLKEALDTYGDVVVDYLNQFDSKIDSADGNPVDIVELIYWWAFDVMGELTLSAKFNMLRTGEWHSAITILRRFMALLGPCTPVPWLGRIGFSIPGVTKDWNKMIQFCKDQTQKRLAIKEERCDISQSLIEHARQNEGFDPDARYLNGDVIAMIIAGSDTLASAMVYVLYHVAAEPVYQKAITDEIASAHVSDLHDAQTLQNLPMLDAVIKETLRLHPPVVTGGPRDTGPDGLWVAGTFIPPYTTVCTPRYTIARLPTAFSEPDSFLPSRWLRDDNDERFRIHNAKAFVPFGAGKYGCIGRAWAMRQLRVTLARLVTKYDISLAPGERGVEVETEMRDQFTAVPGSLQLRFSAKDKS